MTRFIKNIPACSADMGLIEEKTGNGILLSGSSLYAMGRYGKVIIYNSWWFGRKTVARQGSRSNFGITSGVYQCIIDGEKRVFDLCFSKLSRYVKNMNRFYVKLEL